VSDQKIGDLMDRLGVTADLRDDDMISDIVVLMKVVAKDGTPSLGMGKSEGTSDMDEHALVLLAADIMRASGWRERDDE
jgi:Flp pilus assembly CpaF family ATPase